MMQIKSPFESESSFPQLSPLIDVLFLLLVFFMLTTTFQESEGEQSDIKVELPIARETSAPLSREQAVTVGIFPDGAYEVEGIKCKRNELQELITNHLSETKTAILISGDRRAPFESVVYLYDVMQVLGIRQFSHEVRSRP